MRHVESLPASPRFEGLRPRSQAASRVGAANRRRNTKPEILLRRALWAAGVRYRLHVPGLPGRPDIVVRRARLVIFCDGDFWHGRKWHSRARKLQAGWNSDYWVAKISRNRARDKENNRALRMSGWTVIRVWESDVTRRTTKVVRKIIKSLGGVTRVAQKHGGAY